MWSCSFRTTANIAFPSQPKRIILVTFPKMYARSFQQRETDNWDAYLYWIFAFQHWKTLASESLHSHGHQSDLSELMSSRAIDISKCAEYSYRRNCFANNLPCHCAFPRASLYVHTITSLHSICIIQMSAASVAVKPMFSGRMLAFDGDQRCYLDGIVGVLRIYIPFTAFRLPA